MTFSFLRLGMMIYLGCSFAEPAFGQGEEPVIGQIEVLTIHVSDTNVHERVFQLLTHVLKLPVDYYPEMAGARRYAAVYAGNLFIEPCGPYETMDYVTNDFQAIFFGLNCTSDRSPLSLSNELARLNITAEPVGAETFRIRDRTLVQGIYLGVTGKVGEKPAKETEPRFQAGMEKCRKEGVGFEDVKEIRLGYAEPGQLRAWETVLGRSRRLGEGVWQLNRHQTLRLEKTAVSGVQGIVCRVGSLERAEAYLKAMSCFGGRSDRRVQLDKTKTYGLEISLVAD